MAAPAIQPGAAVMAAATAYITATTAPQPVAPRHEPVVVGIDDLSDEFREQLETRASELIAARNAMTVEEVAESEAVTAWMNHRSCDGNTSSRAQLASSHLRWSCLKQASDVNADASLADRFDLAESIEAAAIQQAERP